jgi:hypothetical protein
MILRALRAMGIKLLMIWNEDETFGEVVSGMGLSKSIA